MMLHITTEAALQTAIQTGIYASATLQQEGFIHCCLPHQLTGVVQRYYATADHMLVMHIDESKLASPVKYEPSPLVPELFPHVYGTINMDAVQTIEPLVR